MVELTFPATVATVAPAWAAPPLPALMVAAGAALLAAAIWRWSHVRRVPEGPARNIRRLRVLLHGFTAFVVATFVGGIGLGWLLEERWVVTLSTVFGLEELWEAWVILGSLRAAERVERRSTIPAV